MANLIAVVVDGQWVPLHAPPQPQPVTPDATAQAVAPRTDVQVIDDSMPDLDKAVAHLGAVTRLARYLSERDAQRLREFVHATSAVLAATTRLAGPDQSKFERAIRGQ
ncbi:MAG: hypothetical protein ACXVOI_09505 [Tumebacillaceae bacterium]